jgi:hypothetical protein
MHGILEGKELSNRLPFSFNMDILNAVSFTKGTFFFFFIVITINKNIYVFFLKVAT